MSFSTVKIETERLVIQPLRKENYDAWYQAYSKRQPSQSPYDDGYIDLTPCTKDWFANLVRRHRHLAEEDKQYIFAIFTKSGRHLGMIDVVVLARANMNWCELGYFIHNQDWRCGYAYESLSALIEQLYPLLNCHRIEAHVSLANTPSRHLLEKIGFQLEVIREQFMFEDGQWIDKAVYVLNLHNNRLE
ncbi:GNAT family N-acetyltransferase [Streptococcus halotolerans]|uniref:GNAT family N-acetyltransferase n=1 Tax=Streptococcus halotolerans TaxID=1814128 RepID=UPI000788D506|nr:GNAT family N-acetyltransferase [Streptococcus halotolerans]